MLRLVSNAQEEILQVFVAADKAANKAETGVVNKADARLALEAHLKVGHTLAGLQAARGRGLKAAVVLPVLVGCNALLGASQLLHSLGPSRNF